MNPSGRLCRRWSELTKKPAPISRNTHSAICTATSVPVSRRWPRCPRISLSAPAGVVADARSACANPNVIVTATMSATPRATARTSRSRINRTGRSAGASNDTMNGAAHQANSAPAPHARVASSALSSSISCSRRPRVAPSDSRSASSARRARARVIWRLATFAQAMSSRSVASDARIHSGRRKVF